MFEQYEHHGVRVWVRRELKGLHRQHCLCYSCVKFAPAAEANCTIAKDNFHLSLRYHLVTPVYECPEFVEKGSDSDVFQ